MPTTNRMAPTAAPTAIPMMAPCERPPPPPPQLDELIETTALSEVGAYVTESEETSHGCVLSPESRVELNVPLTLEAVRNTKDPVVGVVNTRVADRTDTEPVTVKLAPDANSTTAVVERQRSQ
jgi:hypothetical protein